MTASKKKVEYKTLHWNVILRNKVILEIKYRKSVLSYYTK